MQKVILRLPEVMARTGVSRSTIYQWVSQNKFPSPISLGDRAVGWVEAEVESWISKKIDEAGSKGGAK